jgi:hypothetical protein
MGRVTPWATGRGGLDVAQAGGVLGRRGVLVLGWSSQLLLLRLDVSDVGPGQSVLKKPTLMVWLPLRSRANTSSS